MTDPVNLLQMREMRDAQKLLEQARRGYADTPQLNAAEHEVLEIFTGIVPSDSGEGSNICFLFCRGEKDQRCVIGAVLLAPEQWAAVREAGDHLTAILAEMENPPGRA